MATQRICTSCGVVNDGTNFHKGGVAKDNLHSKCKKCRNKYNNASRSTPEFRAQRYGISLDDMNKMLQAGCSICGSFDKLIIDHDHSCCDKQNYSCGKCVRGVLCNKCNLGLAHFEDSIDKMLSAIEYIRRNSGNSLY